MALSSGRTRSSTAEPSGRERRQTAIRPFSGTPLEMQLYDLEKKRRQRLYEWYETMRDVRRDLERMNDELATSLASRKRKNGRLGKGKSKRQENIRTSNDKAGDAASPGRAVDVVQAANLPRLQTAASSIPSKKRAIPANLPTFSKFGEGGGRAYGSI